MPTAYLTLATDSFGFFTVQGANPKLKVGFVGPPVTIEPEKVLQNAAVDFVVRREFDYQIASYATGAALEELPGVSFRKNGSIIHNPEGGVMGISTSYLG